MSVSIKLLFVIALAYISGCLAATNFIVEYSPEQLSEIESQLKTRGYTVVRQYPSFNRLVVSGGDLAATAGTGSSLNRDDLDRLVSDELGRLGGVAGVAEGGMRHLFPQPLISDIYADNSTGVCADSDASLGPDADLGRTTEGVPYGIHMVQADDPEMIEISKKFRNKVLFCVVDTGLDRTNVEFNNASTSGCMPGFPDGDANQPYRYCYTWYQDSNRHGTHTSGTVAAARNGKGVVGVSAEGAQLYHYNYFGPQMQAADDLEVAAWQECIAELDRRKLATSISDMKLVISMSYGSSGETSFSKDAIKSLAKQRSDVLWVAAAGNGGDNTTNYPAGYDEVISIAAVDWERKVASFSTFNGDVELAAPGVQTLSTIPLAMTNTSDYYFRPFAKDMLSTSPPLPEVANDDQFFSKPKLAKVEGAAKGNITAPLVDCGLAASACSRAEGKICLIQRGNNTFCDKILNCAAGGGVGVILYNRADAGECDRLAGVTVDLCAAAPEAGWPLAITASRQQGQALRSALEATPDMTASIHVPDVQPKTDYGLEMLSGTSMATPTAAGVTGLVWSAHTRCTSAEIRAALAKTAVKPDNSTGRDQHYGYGIIQAKAAHEYLKANPCNSSTLKVDMVINTINAPTASKSSWVVVAVTISESTTGQKVAGQKVQLMVTPNRKAVVCQSYKLTTNSNGVATTNCQLAKASSTTITARAAGVTTTKSFKAAKTRP